MNEIEKPDNLEISYLQKLHRWRIAFFGVVILLAGIVIGGATMLILMPHKLMRPPRGPEFDSMRMISPLRRDLGLSSEQSEKIKPILEKHMEKLDEIRMDARTEIGETLKQMNKEISAVITNRQKQIWQRELDRLQRELHRGGPRRGEGAGGPRYRRGEQERFRRGPGPGPFGPQRPPGPNFPRNGLNRGTVPEGDEIQNKEL
ncbi:MAG: hypothetical protein ACYS80_18245 [Planctomycetota bacterium]